MKFCTRCGSKLSDSQSFCTKCGAKITSKVTKDNTTITNTSLNTDDTQNINVNQSLNLNKSSNNTTTGETLNISPKVKSFDVKKKTISKKSQLILGSCTILIVLCIASALYFSKDTLLYNHYFNKATSVTSINEKIINYNKALKYNYNSNINDAIFLTLKSDSYFMDYVTKLTNLKKEDKNKLIVKLATAKADESIEKGNYEQCLKYINLGAEHGLIKEDYINYKSLTNKLDEQKNNASTNKVNDVYNFKNENPTSLQGNIYSYKGDYINPYSNYTYLSSSELKDYNKETLALMRNEIYARHGYVFNTEPFKSYFNSKWWYKPNSSFKGQDIELNDYEIKNVKTIKSIEDSK